MRIRRLGNAPRRECPFRRTTSLHLTRPSSSFRVGTARNLKFKMVNVAIMQKSTGLVQRKTVQNLFTYRAAEKTINIFLWLKWSGDNGISSYGQDIRNHCRFLLRTSLSLSVVCHRAHEILCYCVSEDKKHTLLSEDLRNKTAWL